MSLYRLLYRVPALRPQAVDVLALLASYCDEFGGTVRQQIQNLEVLRPKHKVFYAVRVHRQEVYCLDFGGANHCRVVVLSLPSLGQARILGPWLSHSEVMSVCDLGVVTRDDRTDARLTIRDLQTGTVRQTWTVPTGGGLGRGLGPPLGHVPRRGPSAVGAAAG